MRRGNPCAKLPNTVINIPDQVRILQLHLLGHLVLTLAEVLQFLIQGGDIHFLLGGLVSLHDIGIAVGDRLLQSI